MNDFSASSFSDPGSTSSSLVAGVRSLDPESWKRFTLQYGPLVYAWARRAGLHGPDAADITQDVFRSVLYRADRLRHDRPGDNFRGWLWAVTRNTIRDHWRRHSVPAVGGSDAFERLQSLPAPDFSSDAFPSGSGRLNEAVAKVRDEFEGTSWTAFWRTMVDGQSPARVAEELGISANAVYVSRSRILRRLREVLAADKS